MDGYKLSPEEINDMYSITRERINSIEEKAYGRLFPGYAELKNETEKLCKAKGSEPTEADIAQSLGWPLERVLSLKKDVAEYRSRIDSAATPLDLENFVNNMPPEYQKELRDVLKGMEGK